jgi:hypothetical protein
MNALPSSNAYPLDLVRNQPHQSSSSLSSSPTPPRRVNATDPFHFYSDPKNLNNARNFKRIDYDVEEKRQREAGNTVRKSRISFERDAFSLMLEAKDLYDKI